MQRYHDGGTVATAQAPGLAANEVPAILMGGPKGTREEVLHASDPRHRDNMGAALLRLIASGGAMRGNAAGYSKPAVRYHSGGIAGLQPDRMPNFGSPAGAGDREGARGSAGRGGNTFIFHMPPGTSRESADQLASRMAQKIASASSRNN